MIPHDHRNPDRCETCGRLITEPDFFDEDPGILGAFIFMGAMLFVLGIFLGIIGGGCWLAFQWVVS